MLQRWADVAGWHNNIYRKMGKGSFIVAEQLRALVEKATCSQWSKSRALRLQGALSQSTGANRICGGRRADPGDISTDWGPNNIPISVGAKSISVPM